MEKIQSKNFRFLARYLKPFSSQLIIIFLAITIVTTAILGLGYALRYLIDQGFIGHNFNNLNNAFAILLLMVVLLSIASYHRSFRINWICEKLEASLKQDAYNNIINISPIYFELNKVSDIFSRLTTDLTLISNTIVMIASFSLRNILMAIGGLILLLFNSIKLTSYVLLILPIIMVPLIVIGRKTRKLAKENQQDIALCNSHIEESLNFIKTVQAYNREKFESHRFDMLVAQNQSVARKRIKLRSLLFSLVIGLVLSSVALVLWIGGHDVLMNKMSAGELSSFIFYSVLVATSIGSLSEVYSDWQRANGALERVIEIIEAKSVIFETIAPLSLKLDYQPKLSIKDISFSYPSRPDLKVLENINIDVNAGSTVAIVGPSGAGKSTIFQLLLRFYDPALGLITLDDVDITKLKLEDLRESFAFVSQDSVIFSGTAYDNILYGKLDATKEEVEEAAKAAEIFEFFDSLEEGLNSFVGEKGIKLSGGQKQRIAIARAILRNPKILLLDEATSSLDSENERLVQLALTRLRKNRTTLVIAHRISTIIHADLIIVLDKGKVRAKGTHEELLKISELYQRLNQDHLFK